MTAPRKVYGIFLKPRVRIAPRKKVDMATPEGKQEARDILRQVIEEHREVIERLADR